MTVNLASLVAELQKIEAAAPGILATIRADVTAVENNAVVNGLIAHFAPAFAGKEQEVVADIVKGIDFLTAGLSKIKSPLDTLIALLSSLQPAPVTP